MQDLLLNPAVQSAALPALAALVAWALFGRNRALAAVPLAAWATVVVLAVGFTVEPMTARSKLVIALAAAGAIALLLDVLRVEARLARFAAPAALAAVAALWIAQRVLGQREGGAAWALGVAVAAWAAAMTASAAALASAAQEPAQRALTLRALVAAAALGFTIGALGLLGASASVAMLGIALGSACGVALVAALATGRVPPPLGWFAVPAAVLAALGGEVASLTGQLPWFALLPLPLVPLAARWAPRRTGSSVGSPVGAGMADAALASAACALPASIAVALAWQAAVAASG